MSTKEESFEEGVHVSHLSEEEIRPSALMAQQHVADLVDLGRMLSCYGDFVEIACPACENQQAQLKFEKNGLRYVDCLQCQTMYVNPRPTAEILSWFYADSPNYAYWNDVIFPASEEARRQKIFIPRVDRILKLCEKYEIHTDTLLEVGGGFGTFCDEVNQRQIFSRVVVIEPTPKLAQTCRDRDLEVIESVVEDAFFGKNQLFDVVVSFEVIEHLFSPSDFVQQMVRLLKPGGMLILSCPNGQGFDIQTLGALSNSVDHEHLNYFNPKSLAHLLASCGLEVLETLTPGVLDAELVRKQTLSGAFDLSSQPFLQKVLVDEWEALGESFQDYLITQGLSSNMWIVAKK
ncbi:MAG: class I SAM-dependent methyltransferase [Zetaproteobacteria bacterium]|nr:class I SAM-dependent methyltransferase [Zetaproteobacteria bacterium]